MLRRIKKAAGRFPLSLLRHGHYRSAALAQEMVSFCATDRPLAKRVLIYIRNSKRLYDAEKRTNQRVSSRAGHDYPILLINRDCDSRRLKLFQARAGKLRVPFNRISAIDCADTNFDFGPFENEIGEDFRGQSLFLRGAVGCFLSHVRAWQRVLAAEASIGLILEDDARILGPVPASAAAYDIPADADLIFTNHRTAEGILIDEFVGNLRTGCFAKVPLGRAIFELQSWTNPITGPGTDGYIVTRKGAQKLLRLYAMTRISMEVDWFLIFHSMNDAEIERFRKKDGTGRFDLIRLAQERLCSYVMIPSLVEQASLDSGIGFDNPKNYIDRAQMFRRQTQERACGSFEDARESMLKSKAQGTSLSS